MAITYELVCSPICDDLRAEMFTLAKSVFGSSDPVDGQWRIENMPNVTLFVARRAERLVGFKTGYAVTSKRYYSWLGGVHPDYRQQGIARELMAMQHQWVADRGYSVLETEVREYNDVMASLNTSCGYQATGEKLAGDEQAIIYRKVFAGP